MCDNLCPSMPSLGIATEPIKTKQVYSGSPKIFISGKIYSTDWASPLLIIFLHSYVQVVTGQTEVDPPSTPSISAPVAKCSLLNTPKSIGRVLWQQLFTKKKII